MTLAVSGRWRSGAPGFLVYHTVRKHEDRNECFHPLRQFLELIVARVLGAQSGESFRHRHLSDALLIVAQMRRDDPRDVLNATPIGRDHQVLQRAVVLQSYEHAALLRRMVLILPAGESDHWSGFGGRLGVGCVNWVNAIGEAAPARGGLFARFGQGYCMQRPESHLPRPQLWHVAKDPAFGSGRPYLDVQPAAVGIRPGTRQSVNRFDCKLVESAHNPRAPQMNGIFCGAHGSRQGGADEVPLENCRRAVRFRMSLGKPQGINGPSPRAG
jgi:hypothetical protein